MSKQQVRDVEQAAIAGAETALRPPEGQEKLKSERVQEELKSMPGWSLLPGGLALYRSREFSFPADAAKYASYAVQLAANENQRVHLQFFAPRVVLIVHYRQTEGGISEALLGFARQLG